MTFADWVNIAIFVWLLLFALFIWTLGCRWYWKPEAPMTQMFQKPFNVTAKDRSWQIRFGGIYYDFRSFLKFRVFLVNVLYWRLYPMAVPQSILDSLAVVDGDEAAVDTAIQTSSASNTALAAATEKAANDEHAVVQAKTKLTTDKQAFIDLVNNTYKGDGSH